MTSTSAIGFFCVAPASPVALAAVAGTCLCSFSGAALNQLIERKPDSMMSRTNNRPLVRKDSPMPVSTALAHATWTAGLGAGVLLHWTDPVTTALAVGNIALYAGVYTPLKQISSWNTAVGAVVGSIPPVIGWSAASQALLATPDPSILLSPIPLMLFATLYTWQWSHFMAIAYLCRDDYAKAGYKMLAGPSDPNQRGCATLFLGSSVAYFALPFVCAGTGLTSWAYPIVSLLVTYKGLTNAFSFYMKPSVESARVEFVHSLRKIVFLLVVAMAHSHYSNFDLLSSICPHELYQFISGPENCPDMFLKSSQANIELGDSISSERLE